MLRIKTTEKPKTAPKRKTVKPQIQKPSQKAREKVPPNEDDILKPSFKKHCSYCGKPSTQAQILIAGPPPLYPYICDECVEVCVRVLLDGGMQDWRSRLIDILASGTKLEPTNGKGLNANTKTKGKT